MTNADITRIINSDEIQSAVRQPKTAVHRRPLKKNPLKNLGAMLKLNPYAKTARRIEILTSAKRAAAKKAKAVKPVKKSKEVKAVGKKFLASMQVQNDYTGEDYDVFNNWLNKEKKTA